jgi:hypothetical protein
MHRGKVLHRTMSGGKLQRVSNVSHLVCLSVCLPALLRLIYSVYIWFVDSGMSVPRAVWTPSSQQVRQGNLSAMEELVTSSNNLDTNNSSSSATLHNTGLVGSNTSPGWWQHQALQVSSRFTVLCSSMKFIFLH